MSATPRHKSHAMTWALTIILLAVPLLYVLSLPPLFQFMGWGSLRYPARWETYTKPYVWLITETPLDRPLSAYCRWWARRADAWRSSHHYPTPLPDPFAPPDC